MSVVTVRNPVEGERISAQEICDGGLRATYLFPAEVEQAERYISDDWGNVVLVMDRENSVRLFVVQSIDLEFS